MDPLTLLLIIGTGAVAASGLGAASVPLWRHHRLRQARELINRPIVGARGGGGAARSIYEIFSDLGSSEYAIEVLRHMDLIPEKEEDLERVAANLTDAIDSFGGYGEMVESLRETIAELHEESAEEGRARLTLMAPKGQNSLLPAMTQQNGLPEGEEIKQLPEHGSEPGSEDESSGPERAPGPMPDEATRLHATVDEALADLFGGRSPTPDTLKDGLGGVAAIVIGGVLGSLTTGGFWEGVSRFVQRRHVNQMRTKLNQELSALSLAVYHAPSDIQERVEGNLEAFLQESRWRVERHRREAARHQKLPKKQRSTAQLALKLLASKNARDGLKQAQRDIRQLRSQITKHRRGGRHDLAGFLLYVNREHLLAGIEEFDERLEAVEAAGEQLRQAMLAEVPDEEEPAPSLPP